MNVFGMGPLELFLILALALVVFGPEKLPDLARQVGKTMGELRRVSSEVTGEIQRGLQIEDPAKALRTAFRPPAQPAAPPPDSSAAPAATPFTRSPSDDVRPPY